MDDMTYRKHVGQNVVIRYADGSTRAIHLLDVQLTSIGFSVMVSGPSQHFVKNLSSHKEGAVEIFELDGWDKKTPKMGKNILEHWLKPNFSNIFFLAGIQEKTVSEMLSLVLWDEGFTRNQAECILNTFNGYGQLDDNPAVLAERVYGFVSLYKAVQSA